MRAAPKNLTSGWRPRSTRPASFMRSRAYAGSVRLVDAHPMLRRAGALVVVVVAVLAAIAVVVATSGAGVGPHDLGPAADQLPHEPGLDHAARSRRRGACRRSRQQARADESNADRCLGARIRRRAVPPRRSARRLREPALAGDLSESHSRRARTHRAGDRDGNRERRPRRGGIGCPAATPRAGTTTASTGWVRHRRPSCNATRACSTRSRRAGPWSSATAGEPVRVVGRLDWVPGPSGWPWLPVIVGLGALGFRSRVPGAGRGRDRGRRGVGRRRPRARDHGGDGAAGHAAGQDGAVLRRQLRVGDRVDRGRDHHLGTAPRRRRRAVRRVAGRRDGRARERSHRSVVALEVAAPDRGPVRARSGRGRGRPRARPRRRRGRAGRALRRCASRPRRPRRATIRAGSSASSAISTTKRSRSSCNRLVADEVIPLALAEFGRRAPRRSSSAFGSDALVFVVLAQDEIGSHVWSITAGTAGLARPARDAGARPRRAAHDVSRVPAAPRRCAHARASWWRPAVSTSTAIAVLVAAVEPYLRPDAPARPAGRYRVS